MKIFLILTILTLPLSAEETKQPTVEELKAQIEKLQAEVKSCSAVREAWKGLALQDAVQKFVATVEQKAIDEAAKK